MSPAQHLKTVSLFGLSRGDRQQGQQLAARFCTKSVSAVLGLLGPHQDLIYGPLIKALSIGPSHSVAIRSKKVTCVNSQASPWDVVSPCYKWTMN